ncbi:hypothetical protein ACFO25_09585 [Paenactinomyces guangxiensis]|uniref:Uncharacterized protein n=1 Tax=Paenactinomyces guangxiensis TaxID=1490290 RepID=A0A7W2A725_9BACL|nr:hypothetical protein [Paenactinomyces guangxiensis]MBA4492709.1 hypothetical protein [Paenactinomyces guangxiensis]MBH8590443.1 hypothetical protein [Paenactinomyces guangxiensis]
MFKARRVVGNRKRILRKHWAIGRKMFRGAVGSLKHEGIYLTNTEQELLRAYCEGRITEDEYNRKALELVMKG